MQNLKTVQRNLYKKQKQIHRHVKQTMFTQGERQRGQIRNMGLTDTNYYT